MPKPSPLTFLLYQALGTKLGIIVRAEEGQRDKLRQQLYQARSAAMDESLTCLQFRFSPTEPNEIMIIKGDTSL
jgi:quinol monooxygenase YgiN